MKSTPDLNRRRAILWSYIGAEIGLKRESITPRDPLKGRVGVLRDIKRTRCVVDFVKLDKYGAPALEGGDTVAEEWALPINMVLLPGSVEPDPRQRELFE